jgi:hypothetical protein
MSDDGRFLTVLTLLGLAGAAAARGSRGVVRASRPPPEPREIRIIRTRVSEARDYGRPLYVWTARRGERQIGSGWYDHETGYSRQGGSGKGAAVKAGLRELGFKNRISDQEMRHLLEAYPADAELLIDSAGGFKVILRQGSPGVVRRGREGAVRTLRSPASPRGDVPLTEVQERDAWDAGYESASRYHSKGTPLDPDTAFPWSILQDRRIPVRRETDLSFWEYELAFREGFVAYAKAHGLTVHGDGSRGVVRAGRSSSHGSTRDRPEYTAYVLVSRPEEADPAVIDSGWERPEDAERRVEILRATKDVDLELRILPRRGLRNHGIDPLDDGRWRS